MLAVIRARTRIEPSEESGQREQDAGHLDNDEDDYFHKLHLSEMKHVQADIDAINDVDVHELVERVITKLGLDCEAMQDASTTAVDAADDAAVDAAPSSVCSIASETQVCAVQEGAKDEKVPETLNAAVDAAPSSVCSIASETQVCSVQEGAKDEKVPETLNVVLEAPRGARAPMNSEETHLKQWFDEAFMKVDMHMHEHESTKWIQCDVEGHRVVMSQQRMREVGIVMEDGSLPLTQDPAQLYWIQDKPEGFKNKFGVWDPIGAQWRIFLERNIVPIEQRIAPLGKGYGATPGNKAHEEMDTFKLCDYGNDSQYTDTALEPGLPYILSQIESLGTDVELSAGTGWATNPANNVAYYTPLLRHVQIDASVSESAGKKYVYGFFTAPPVKPVEGDAQWDATNSVWVYAMNKRCDTRFGTPFKYCERLRDKQIARGS